MWWKTNRNTDESCTICRAIRHFFNRKKPASIFFIQIKGLYDCPLIPTAQTKLFAHQHVSHHNLRNFVSCILALSPCANVSFLTSNFSFSLPLRYGALLQGIQIWIYPYSQRCSMKRKITKLVILIPLSIVRNYMTIKEDEDTILVILVIKKGHRYFINYQKIIQSHIEYTHAAVACFFNSRVDCIFPPTNSIFMIISCNV